MATVGDKYTLLTWNVRGLGSPAKRQKVFSYIRRRGVHIACIQVTHLAKGEAIRLQRRWRGRVYATEASTFARGALIWVRPEVLLEVSKTGVDKEDRWVFVKGKLGGQEITLGCIYALNQGQLEFL